ncbi:hypothetical protein GLOIN_2v1704131, partial [Rhizophagus irregularis DAOM 181602=DAOM 197198]
DCRINNHPNPHVSLDILYIFQNPYVFFNNINFFIITITAIRTKFTPTIMYSIISYIIYKNFLIIYIIFRVFKLLYYLFKYS